jgi:hypothetical protein
MTHRGADGIISMRLKSAAASLDGTPGDPATILNMDLDCAKNLYRRTQTSFERAGKVVLVFPDSMSRSGWTVPNTGWAEDLIRAVCKKPQGRAGHGGERTPN